MLKDELKKFSKQFKDSAPSEIIEKIEESTAKLAEGKLLQNALKVGSKMPKFKLTNATGQNIDSEDMLSKGPLVINFYRGGW